MAEYVFDLKPTQDERLVPQLAAALDKCAELASRARLPGLWRLIDRIRNVPRASEKTLRRRRVLYRVYGVIMLISGLILLIPGLMAPRELLEPLIVGALAATWGVYCIVHRVGREQQGRKRDEERRFKRYEKEARKLAEGLADSRRAGMHLRFTEKEMTVEGAQGERQTLPYSTFRYAAETRELLLLRGNTEGFTLQKRELTWGNFPEFRAFLAARGVMVAPAGEESR